VFLSKQVDNLSEAVAAQGAPCAARIEGLAIKGMPVSGSQQSFAADENRIPWGCDVRDHLDLAKGQARTTGTAIRKYSGRPVRTEYTELCCPRSLCHG